MKLRQKSFLLIAVAFLGATLLVYATTRFAGWRGFDQLEEQEALRLAAQLKKLVLSAQDELARDVHLLATLAPAAESVPADTAALEKFLSAGFARDSAWSLLARADGASGSVWARTADGSAAPPAAALAALFTAPPSAEAGASSPRSQIVTLAGEPHLVATQAPWLVARKIDARFCAQAGALLDAPVRLVAAAAPSEGVRAHTEFLIRDERGALAACTVLSDDAGRPLAVLRVDYHAPFRKQSAHFLTIFMTVLVAGVVLLCVWLDRMLLGRISGRLARMGRVLQHIQQSGGLSERLAIEGQDEITTLTQETNRLLASVEASHQALERANAQMQQRVAERTTALADANAALEADIAERIKAEQEREQLREQLILAQKMEAVGTLAGGIAHDFNNILTGILGHAQLLGLDLPPGSPGHANLKQIMAAAERAAALVKKILAFSRQTPGERRLVTVSQVASEALSLLRAGLPAGIAIRCQPETNEDVVLADPTQLHQVFMNLGTNAGHAMGTQGGELEVHISLRTLRPGAHPELVAGEYVVASVRDTGCGMSPEVMSRIFDPFFSTKPVNEGTGLGLAVVHGIVSDHGGAIDVESRVGLGTTFRLWLPAVRSKADALAAEPSAPLKGDERILLVDDEEIVRSVLEKGLQRLGYRVTAVASGPIALARFETAPADFDLVITDQTMPQMSGLQLSSALRARRPELPIILVTGYSPEVAGRDAASLGLAGIVAKPIHFTELTQLMRRAISRAGR